MHVVTPAGVVAENAGVPAGASSVLNFVGGGAAFNPATGALDLTLGGVTWPLVHGGDELFQPNDANAQNMLGLHVDPGFSASGGLLSNGTTIPYAGLYITGTNTYQSSVDGAVLGQVVVLDTGGNPLYLFSAGGDITIDTEGSNFFASSEGGDMHLDTLGGEMLLTVAGGPLTVDLEGAESRVILDISGVWRVQGDAFSPWSNGGGMAYAASLAKVVAVAARVTPNVAIFDTGSGDWSFGSGDCLPGSDGLLGRPSGIAWSDALSRFVVVGQSNDGTNLIATSPDGVTWTGQGNLGGGYLSLGGVLRVDTLGFYLAWEANATFTSTDGVTWSGPVDPLLNVAGVTWAPALGLFVATGRQGFTATTYISTSPDGITWTLAGSTIPISFGDVVAWGPTPAVFVACQSNDRHLATSPDGVTWTAGTDFPAGFHAHTITWSDHYGLFCVGGQKDSAGNNASFTSPDGVTWTPQGNPFPVGSQGDVDFLYSFPADPFALGFGWPNGRSKQWTRHLPPQGIDSLNATMGTLAPDVVVVTGQSIDIQVPLTVNAGFAAWNHAPPAAQPATPVTLGDVIAALQAYGITA